MNGFGIRVPSGRALNVNSACRFEGGGETPMFTVEAGAMLAFSERKTEIIVENGCAILLEGNDTPERYALNQYYCRISASGEGAVAVRAEQNLELGYARIEATDGALAVDARGDARLFLCEIRGAVRTGGALTVDASSLSPEAGNATVLTRSAVLLRDPQFVSLFREQNGELNLPEKLPYLLCSPDAPEKQLEPPVQWKTDGADLSTPGIYAIMAVPEQLPADVGVAFPSEEITLVVTEPEKIYLTRVEPSAGQFRLVLNSPAPDGAGLTLFCSVDGGPWEVWQENLQDQGVGSRFVLSRPLETGVEYRFQLDVEREGAVQRTNLLRVKREEGEMLRSDVIGGDRDDSDRDGPSQLPPPSDETSGDDWSDGEDAEREPEASNEDVSVYSGGHQREGSASSKVMSGVTDPASKPEAPESGVAAVSSEAATSGLEAPMTPASASPEEQDTVSSLATEMETRTSSDSVSTSMQDQDALPVQASEAKTRTNGFLAALPAALLAVVAVASYAAYRFLAGRKKGGGR